MAEVIVGCGGVAHNPQGGRGGGRAHNDKLKKITQQNGRTGWFLKSMLLKYRATYNLN